jgi:multidrug efflux pump subunit AcrB
MITVKYPGASPQVVDETVCAPIEQMIMYMDGVSSITCVSSFDTAKIYVRGGPTSDVASLAKNVENRIRRAQKMMPDSAKVGRAVDISGQQMPPPLDIHNVPVKFIDIDRAKTRSLGVRFDAVYRAIQAPMKSGTLLDNVTVRSDSGSAVRLSDIAKIKTIYEPNYRVRQWPEAADEKAPIKKR